MTKSILENLTWSSIALRFLLTSGRSCKFTDAGRQEKFRPQNFSQVQHLIGAHTSYLVYYHTIMADASFLIAECANWSPDSFVVELSEEPGGATSPYDLMTWMEASPIPKLQKRPVLVSCSIITHMYICTHTQLGLFIKYLRRRTYVHMCTVHMYIYIHVS